MKINVLRVTLYSLVLFMVFSELMVNDLTGSSDSNAKNWTPYIDGTISFDVSAGPVQGNSSSSPAPAIYFGLDDGQSGSRVSPGPKFNHLEPGIMLVLGLGLIGLASFGKRKFRKK